MARSISSSEHAYIAAGCVQGLEDYRSVSIENNIFPQANGSSRVRLLDQIDILCSVKADVGRPSPQAPASGRLEVHVDLSPLSPSASNPSDAENLAETVAACLSQPAYLSLPSLCILPHKHVWVLYVDIIVLKGGEGSSVVDMCVLAGGVAMAGASLPPHVLKKSARGVFDDFDLAAADVVPTPLPLLCALPPVLVTLCRLVSKQKAGKAVWLVDASPEEEAVAQACLTLSFVQSAPGAAAQCTQVSLGRAGGGGGVAADSLPSAVELGGRVASHLFSLLKGYLESAESRGGPEASEDLFPDLAPKRLGMLA
eukprot:gene31586-38174_t